MDIGSVSALSALAGSAVGGLTTGFTTWMSLRSQARAGQHTADVARLRDLFRDFLDAAYKTYADALVSSAPKIEEVVALWALVSRMRILCSPQTTACAERVLRKTLDAFFATPKTTEELNDLIENGTGIDPLREFSEAAREELRALTF